MPSLIAEKDKIGYLGKVWGVNLIRKKKKKRGARGVVLIVVGNEHGDTSSNPGRD